MGLLKEILDKIDVHQDPVYLDPCNIGLFDHKNENRSKISNEVSYDSSTVNITINITINDDDEG